MKKSFWADFTVQVGLILEKSQPKLIVEEMTKTRIGEPELLSMVATPVKRGTTVDPHRAKFE